MNFDFTDEQYMLRDQARAFLAKHCSTAVVRNILESDQGYAKDLWQGVSEMGWTAAAIPEEHDGLGLTEMELCVIAEELGRSLAPVPFGTSIYLASQALMMAGSDEQKQQWLPKLATGQIIGTLALAEGAGSPSYDRLDAVVSDGRLSAKKKPVADGLSADIAVVAAKSEQGILGLYIVELDNERVFRKALSTIDESRPQAEIEFNEARAQLLGEGEQLLEQLLDRAAVLYAFEQLGGAQQSLEMAVGYAKERNAFGRPVGSFQAIKHKLADMYAAVELARANCYYAAWALSSGAKELPVAAATARVSASQAYYHVAKENIQTHGGAGFTWELDAHLFYRRAKALNLVIGGERRWKDVLVSRLNAEYAA